MIKPVMIDPPSGWKYGFPKPWNSNIDGALKEFLLQNGYPEKDIDFAVKYVRMWNIDDENYRS